MSARFLRVRGIAAIMSAIVISPAPETRTRKEHWANDQATKFQCPWPSFVFPSLFKLLGAAPTISRAQSGPEQKYDEAHAEEVVPTLKPTWGTPADAGKMKVTWLGHAACLVEMPTAADADASADPKGGGRGVRFLLDPAFSKRCSPFQSFAPIAPRLQPPISPVADMPEIDAIVISHNHYDHQDNNTLEEIYKKQKDRPPAIFIPLNNTRGLPYSVPRDSIVEMDWWEDRFIEVEGIGKARVTCTPSQHQSARTPFDRNVSLWSSWAIHHIPEERGGAAPSVWFGGDTGYCTRTDDTCPPPPTQAVCPAFKEIGEKLGPFSVGLIPIGAYQPKPILSSVHADPFEAVQIFKDIRCKTALGIHWGVWRMAGDRVADPPKLLEEARKVMGVSEAQFGVTRLGETRAYDP